MSSSRSSFLALLFRSSVLVASIASASGVGPPSESEKSFLSATNALMSTMMAGMEAAPHGDVDQDFAGQMIPHHQGAIDMATAELRYGHNERLRRMAQEIIIEQQAEIAVMRRELSSTPAGSSPNGSK